MAARQVVDPAFLRRVDLFAGLAAHEVADLVPCLRRRRIAKGAVIFLEGDDGSSLYLIESGWVKLVLASPEGKELVLDLLGPGECFGELAVLDGQPRSADALAHEACQILLLRREDFDRFLDAHPRVARTLLTVLSRRLRRDTHLLHEAVFVDLPARLGRMLAHLAEARGEPGPATGSVRLHATQEELAGMLGVTRESVNRWLGFYERRGAVRRRRGEITLLDPAALRPERVGESHRSPAAPPSTHDSGLRISD